MSRDTGYSMLMHMTSPAKKEFRAQNAVRGCPKEEAARKRRHCKRNTRRRKTHQSAVRRPGRTDCPCTAKPERNKDADEIMRRTAKRRIHLGDWHRNGGEQRRASCGQRQSDHQLTSKQVDETARRPRRTVDAVPGGRSANRRRRLLAERSEHRRCRRRVRGSSSSSSRDSLAIPCERWQMTRT
jgi:hypothetical protein